MSRRAPLSPRIYTTAAIGVLAACSTTPTVDAQQALQEATTMIGTGNYQMGRADTLCTEPGSYDNCSVVGGLGTPVQYAVDQAILASAGGSGRVESYIHVKLEDGRTGWLEYTPALKRDSKITSTVSRYKTEIDELKNRCDEVFASLRIGMRASQVQNQQTHGRCATIHSTETARGIREQWIWGDNTGRYVYFDNGILTAIQR